MLNKCRTRAEAIVRYGHIDFASKTWAQQSKWMSMLEIPKEWFPDWHVLDTKHPVEAIFCNNDIHDPLMKALKAIHDGGMGKMLHTYDGCFNIRMVRGTNNSPSTHSYGLALDLNANENQLGASKGGFYLHPEFVECFKTQGFDWGGDFHSRKDAMHFSWCWE